MLNLCAQLQIDLVQLTIISQAWKNKQALAADGEPLPPPAPLVREAKEILRHYKNLCLECTWSLIRQTRGTLR